LINHFSLISFNCFFFFPFRHLTGFLQAQARGKDQDISWFSKKIAVFAENFVVLALATPGPGK